MRRIMLSSLLRRCAGGRATGCNEFGTTVLLATSRLSSSSTTSTMMKEHAAAAADESIPPSHSPAADPAALRQLYKSSHKGSGNAAMPKHIAEKPLRPRKQPAAAEALFGARSSCSEDAGPVPNRALSPLQKRQLLFKNKAAFVLSPQALRRVKYLLSQYSINHPSAAAPAAAPSSSSFTSASTGELPTGIRIGVRRRGCSGYSYTVNYFFPSSIEKSAKLRQSAGGFMKMDDVVVEQDGVKVVVDGDALFYVIGTEMDYVVRNVEEKFTFQNPNQKYGCGCEESFMPFDGDDMDDNE